jgi:hypothetical protein
MNIDSPALYCTVVNPIYSPALTSTYGIFLSTAYRSEQIKNCHLMKNMPPSREVSADVPCEENRKRDKRKRLNMKEKKVR